MGSSRFTYRCLDAPRFSALWIVRKERPLTGTSHCTSRSLGLIASPIQRDAVIAFDPEGDSAQEELGGRSSSVYDLRVACERFSSK